MGYIWPHISSTFHPTHCSYHHAWIRHIATLFQAKWLVCSRWFAMVLKGAWWCVAARSVRSENTVFSEDKLYVLPLCVWTAGWSERKMCSCACRLRACGLWHLVTEVCHSESSSSQASHQCEEPLYCCSLLKQPPPITLMLSSLAYWFCRIRSVFA